MRHFNDLSLLYCLSQVFRTLVSTPIEYNIYLYTILEQDDSDGCGVCLEYEFKCSNNIENCCIPSEWRCDQFVDCDDGLDEQNCAANYLQGEIGKHKYV